jgi:DNA-binding response OmpR family regulator
VIEPDDIMSDMINRTITYLGHGAVETKNLILARQICQENLPDVVVIDGGYPKGASLEFCTWFKGLKGGESVPILTLTQTDSFRSKLVAVQNTVDALVAGSDDFIAKPFTIQELRARIKSLVRTRTMALNLMEQNKLLAQAQEKIVAQERQLLANQLAATAAHALGQPITALKLNCHLIGVTDQNDPDYRKIIASIKGDVSRLADIIEGLKKINAARTEKYHGDVKILKVDQS